MKRNHNSLLKIQNILLLCLFCLTIIGCDKEEQSIEIEEAAIEDVDDVAHLTNLPFGGSNILIRTQGVAQPDFLSLWLCGLPSNGAGNSDASDWTNADGTWDYTRKPMVEGNVTWTSEFNVLLDGNGNRIITGNALPDHPTGVFPIDPTSVAYQYDRNMNIITAHDVLYVFPAMPQVAATESCVGFGPSGISLSGSAIYHGSSTLGNDASAHEILDKFGGHTDGTETYHYHYPTQELQDHITPNDTGHSELMGYMLDGFGIYGPKGENGELLKSADLDECHGHTHPVLWDGVMVDLYHYHWTYDFPYNIGCYKGTPQ